MNLADAFASGEVKGIYASGATGAAAKCLCGNLFDPEETIVGAHGKALVITAFLFV